MNCSYCHKPIEPDYTNTVVQLSLTDEHKAWCNREHFALDPTT